MNNRCLVMDLLLVALFCVILLVVGRCLTRCRGDCLRRKCLCGKLIRVVMVDMDVTLLRLEKSPWIQILLPLKMVSMMKCGNILI